MIHGRKLPDGFMLWGTWLTKFFLYRRLFGTGAEPTDSKGIAVRT